MEQGEKVVLKKGKSGALINIFEEREWKMFSKSWVMPKTPCIKVNKGHSKWLSIFSVSKELISAILSMAQWKTLSCNHLVFEGNESGSNSSPVLQQKNFTGCLWSK